MNDLPVMLTEKLRLFAEIAMIDFSVTVSLVSTGQLSAMPVQHGGHTTPSVPYCIFLGWDHRRCRNLNASCCFIRVHSPSKPKHSPKDNAV